MKLIVGLCALVFVGITGWQLGGRLSSDAIGMALGVLFGIMAGIPAALMVLAARRHEEPEFDEPRRSRRQQQQHGYGAYPQFPQQQPPVIVVTGQGAPGMQGGGYQQQGYGQPPLMHPNQMQLPGPNDGAAHRQFRVVGETDEVLDSW